MGSLSPIHWLIVAVVVLLLFGPNRLAGAGKGLGEGIRNFKKGLNDEGDDAPKPKPPGEPGQLAPPQDSGPKT